MTFKERNWQCLDKANKTKKAIERRCFPYSLIVQRLKTEIDSSSGFKAQTFVYALTVLSSMLAHPWLRSFQGALTQTPLCQWPCAEPNHHFRKSLFTNRRYINLDKRFQQSIIIIIIQWSWPHGDQGDDGYHGSNSGKPLLLPRLNIGLCRLVHKTLLFLTSCEGWSHLHEAS